MSTNDLFSHPSVLAPDEDRILEYASVAASELMGPNTPLTDYVDTFRKLYCSRWSDEQFYLLLHATRCTPVWLTDDP